MPPKKVAKAEADMADANPPDASSGEGQDSRDEASAAAGAATAATLAAQAEQLAMFGGVPELMKKVIQAQATAISNVQAEELRKEMGVQLGSLREEFAGLKEDVGRMKGTLSEMLSMMKALTALRDPAPMVAGPSSVSGAQPPVDVQRAATGGDVGTLSAPVPVAGPGEPVISPAAQEASAPVAAPVAQ